MAEKPLGNLFVRVSADVANFTKGMTRVETRANKTKTSLRNLGGVSEKLQRQLGGVALAAFTFDTLKLGIAADETASKFGTVFGEAADSMNAFVDSFANAAGLTTVAAQEILANSANIAKGMGLSAEAATSLSRQVILLAGDLGSFNNIPTADAARAITSALTGERESMKRLGIVIKQVDVDARALADSGKTLASELTNADRVAATMAISVEQAGVAVGDLARTNTEVAGTLKTMVAELRDAQTELGQGLVPALAEALQGVNDFVDGVGKIGVGFAVFLGEIKQGFTNLFGGQEARGRAFQEMERLREAAKEVRDEIDGLGQAALPTLATETDTVAEATVTLVAEQRQLAAGTIQFTQAVRQALPPLEQLNRAELMAAIAAGIQEDAMLRAAAATQRSVDIIRTATNASANLFNIWKSNQSFFAKLGSTLQLAGGLVGLIPGGQLLGAGLIGAGTIAGQFAHGGVIPAGQTGIVGEAGPELVEGPAAVTPMGGGGGITINIVTESGRQLVDAIRIKDKRDDDMRRVVRVPIAAIATG